MYGSTPAPGVWKKQIYPQTWFVWLNRSRGAATPLPPPSPPPPLPLATSLLFNFRMRTANHSRENSRNSRSKVEWKENPGKIFELAIGFPPFWKFWKCCSIRYWKLPKVAENSNQTFWLNGKCPLIAIDFSNLWVNAIIFTIYALSPFGKNIIQANSPWEWLRNYFYQ